VRSPIEAVLPFWLDRPDLEAVEIADAASTAGLDGLWIGEMASFDAFALATAVGVRAPGLGLRVGPLPVSVRTPVSIALGASSIAVLTGAPTSRWVPPARSSWRAGTTANGHAAPRGSAKLFNVCDRSCAASAPNTKAGISVATGFGCDTRYRTPASESVRSAR
jgi:hypothetical protein